MEKRKLIPLSMMLLCTICFSACNKTSSNTNIIAKINSNNIIAEDLYEETLFSDKTAEYVYNALEKSLIQSSIPVTNSMRTKVENEVERWQNEIKDNASLNGTKYKEDLQKALDELEVNSVDELVNKKIYDLQVEYAKEKFLTAMEETYKKAYIDTNYLYHISDIALTISSSSSSTDLYNLTISSTEAKAIYDTFNELVDGEKYYNIASQYSKSSSKDKGGDLGIVSLNDNNITNELRYALIGYSSLVEGKYDEFDLPTNIYTKSLTDFYSGGMQAIPYSYIKSLNDNDPNSSSDGKYYESSTSFYYSSGGNSVSSSSKVYYRNIVFNNLLNTKTPKFITVTSDDVANGAHAKLMDVVLPNVNAAGYSTTKTQEYVLTNEQGNPYVVFKDSEGLHILSINKTPFDTDLYDYYSNEESKDAYVSYIEFGNDIEARKEEVKALANKYITRNFGSNSGDEKLLSFAMFKYYMEQPNNGNFKIVDERVKSMIEQYMDSYTKEADLKVSKDFIKYYDNYSNLVWFRNQDVVIKEVPLLSCLSKASDGNYACIYKYGEGFKNHAPTSSSENGGE